MDESRQRQKAMKRTVNRLVIFSAAALIILLSTIFYTLINRSKKSTSIQLAKESVIQFTRPVDRLCFASEAWQTSNTDEAKEALLKAFNFAIRNPGENDELISLRKNYLLDFRQISSPIIFASCTKDNRFIYGYSKDSIFVWDTKGKLYAGFSCGNYPLINLEMSGNGRYIGAVNADSMLTVWDNMGHLNFYRKVGYNSVNEEQIFRFDAENRIIVISSDKEAELLDIDGKLIQSFDNHKGKVNAVDISDDMRFISTAGSDSTVNIWYFNSIENGYDLYNSIHFPADTIFSVDFARNGKYILTTAANGTIRVTSVNGEFAWGIREEYEEGLADISLRYPFFAEFNDSGSGIVIKSTDREYNREEYFMYAIYVDIFYLNVRTGQSDKFNYIRYSPGNNFIAVSDLEDNYLISWNLYNKSNYGLFNNYKLLQFTGKRPFFSPDGKYIYSVCGDHLESLYIDVESISAIALEFYNKWDKYF
ncbi:MAG: hypothetical protein MUF36_12140 [Bacteroidales bacterium]|nr:hypothetical protein [Bacteroidales bacterium]